jgi:metal-responsive CopG/Arc/MetJ family transcriptional regulator
MLGDPEIPNKKWRSCTLLSTLLNEVDAFCSDEKNGFANTSQFINYAVRRELEVRKRTY